MRVRVINFGTNWWAACSHDLSDPMCFRRRAAWFNSAGLKQGRRLRFCWVFPGQIRFNRTSGFNPEFPLRSVGKSFIAPGRTFCMDGRIFCFTLRPKMPYPIGSWSQSMNECTGRFRLHRGHGFPMESNQSQSVCAGNATKQWC
jgi:hypothetical protein